jgi:hypothetical protein
MIPCLFIGRCRRGEQERRGHRVQGRRDGPRGEHPGGQGG